MIIEYAEPVRGLFDTLTTRYSMAIFAWNLSLVEEVRRDELIDEFITPLVGDNTEGRENVTQLITLLTDRRIDLYPNETFLILPIEGYEEIPEGEEVDDDIDDE